MDADRKKVLCGDTIEASGHTCTCTREKGHLVVGFNSNSRKYEFHQGDGMVWDERCAWEEGQEPKRKKR